MSNSPTATDDPVSRPPDPPRTRRYLSPERWLRENPDTIGRTLLYESIRAGTVPSVKLGRRYLVPDDLLDRLLAE
jgi:excisionase family DNA binding protein